MLAWRNLAAELDGNLAELTLLRPDVFLDYFTVAYYCTVTVVLLFVGFNTVFLKWGPRVIQEMNETSRIIFINHCMFLLIFFATCVPYSIALVRILFAENPIEYFATPSTFYMIAFPLGLQTIMWGYEGALRAVVRINRFQVVHHVAFFAFVLLALQSRSVFVGKAGLILSCFATYEWPPFVALVARRLKAPRRFCTAAMALSMAFVVLTRLVQAALLIGLFVEGYGPSRKISKGLGFWWTALVLSILVVVLQCYLLNIYLRIVQRTRRRPTPVPQCPELPCQKPSQSVGITQQKQNDDMLMHIADMLSTTQSLSILDGRDQSSIRSDQSLISDTVTTDIWTTNSDLLPNHLPPKNQQKFWSPRSWKVAK